MQRVLDDVGQRSGDEIAIDEHRGKGRRNRTLEADPSVESNAIRVDDLVEQRGDVDLCGSCRRG